MENILVIEDDLMFCKLLTNYLTKNGYQAAQATDGASAKEQLKQQHFDVALIDYRLPDTNGVDLVRWIKEHGLGSRMIVMSRMLDENLKSEAEALGVDAFLNKPFNPSELLQLLKK